MTTAARACAACQTPLPEDALFCLRCGTATPTDPGVPSRTGTTEVGEVARVRAALAGHYEVERILGEGGMATVYLAEDPKHHRKVAIKVMHPEMAATLGAERFLREVEIAAQLSHPHILPVYDSGSAGGILYYVMPYVEGESLQDRLQRETELPIEDAVRITREVAEALAYAHARNIVHRDIKPANIMMSAGHALVADFGIARATSGGGAAITKTGLSVGTPQYMSPEQANGSPNVDGRADIFALGCVFYEMVAGEPPFTGPTVQAIVIRSMTETPRALTTIREGLSPALDGVVGKALAKSAADRWQTAQQFADALGRAGDTLRSGERPAAVAPPAGPSPAKVWGLFGFATLITLGVFYGLVSRWGLPVWVLYLAIALLAIGAVVLMVTGRMEARRRTGATTPGFARLFTWGNATAGGVLALGTWALVVTGLIIRGPGGAGAGGAVRLAVLPFDNSGAADDAYFVDGIANQIRGKLTGLAGFEVTARSSTDHYKGTAKSPRDIGKELGVDYLLGATVTWAKAGTGGGKVQVSPELIDVRTGASRWQQSFNADVSDVFAVQGQIASEVAGALGVALGAKEQQQLAKRPTQNLAAYDLFLKAQALNVTDPATFRQAAALYEQAVVLDSAFALAWAGLGTSLSLQYFLVAPTPALASRAQQATEKALALGPNEPASHAARAEYLLDIVRDPAQAWEQVSLALAAAPNDPVLLGSAGTIAKNAGRWDDAVRYLQQARRLDPRSIDVAEQLQRVLLFTRRYPEALATGTAALALFPTSLGIIENQATIHLAQGDLGGARAVLAAAPVALSQPTLVAYVVRYWDLYWLLTDEQQQLALRLPVSAMYDDLVGWAMALTQTAWNQGDKAKARAYADTARVAVQAQLKASPDDAQSHVNLGLALAYLGQKDLAIAEGRRAVSLVPISRDHNAGAYFQHQLARIYIRVGEPEPALDAIELLLKVPYLLSPGWLRIDPEFAPLKGNPRFERLIKGG